MKQNCIIEHQLSYLYSVSFVECKPQLVKCFDSILYVCCWFLALGQKWLKWDATLMLEFIL